MIYDHIKNVGLYKGLTPAIDTALDYIAGLDASVENGTYRRNISKHLLTS